MTKKALLITSFLIYLSVISSAQCGYTALQYGFNWERDVTYGTATRYNGASVDLKLNICKPIGDNNLQRPLLLWIHGGGFFGGTKEDMDALCELYAQRGYVSATMSYRLGFYGSGFFGAPFAYDSIEVIRAAYRAIQDAHGALRFMKGRSVIDSTNVNLAFIGGASAGAITALHLTYADKPWEAPAAVDSCTSVQAGFSTVLRPSMGSAYGSLNLNGQSSEVKAVVNIFGALLDTTFVESANDVPLFSYHQTGDPTVGCDFKKGLWNMPLNVGQNYPHLYGSCVIEPRMNNLGYSTQHYQSYLYNGNTHGIHDDVFVDSLIAEFLSNRICELTTDIKLAEEIRVGVAPNPARDLITIKATSQLKAKVKLLNTIGQMVYMGNMNDTGYRIDISNLSPGVYMLALETEKKSIVRKVVVER